jgi:hypothetical protein
MQLAGDPALKARVDGNHLKQVLAASPASLELVLSDVSGFWMHGQQESDTVMDSVDSKHAHSNSEAAGSKQPLHEDGAGPLCLVQHPKKTASKDEVDIVVAAEYSPVVAQLPMKIRSGPTEKELCQSSAQLPSASPATNASCCVIT